MNEHCEHGISIFERCDECGRGDTLSGALDRLQRSVDALLREAGSFRRVLIAAAALAVVSLAILIDKLAAWLSNIQ